MAECGVTGYHGNQYAIAVCALSSYLSDQHHLSRDITERPRAPSGVAAFMSSHSKTPCITLAWIFPLGKG